MIYQAAVIHERQHMAGPQDEQTRHSRHEPNTRMNACNQMQHANLPWQDAESSPERRLGVPELELQKPWCRCQACMPNSSGEVSTQPSDFILIAFAFANPSQV